jgi:hypothetical protein
MPRVRLRVHHVEMPPTRRPLYTDPRRPGESFETPVLRLVTTAVFGSEPKRDRADKRLEIDALIDTGVWLSVIDYSVWSVLNRRGLVEFLPPPVGAVMPRLAIGGGRSEYRLGRVPIGLVDYDEPNPPRRLPAVPVIAQLLTDPQLRLPYPILFGFHGGVLDHRVLRREPVLGYDQATPPRRTDAGPRFGQQWYLETA